jgi:hypothetical protein
MQYIDATPTWEGLLPLLVQSAANGDTVEARREAMDQLLVIARYVDAANAREKAAKAAEFAGTTSGRNNGAPTAEASPSTIRNYRVAGHLNYLLPDGSTGSGVPFYRTNASDNVPGESVAVICDEQPATFHVSGPNKGQGGIARYCAYFEHGGVWYFFYTDGATLPEGSHIEVQA